MGMLSHNKIEETQAGRAAALMKGLREPDTFCESRLGFLPGHVGKALLLLPVLIKSTWCVVTRHKSFFVDALKRLILGNEWDGTIC